jgi:hypothetical protein
MLQSIQLAALHLVSSTFDAKIILLYHRELSEDVRLMILIIPHPED